MSIKKTSLKNKPACKLSFKVTKAQAAGASRISIVGDFNSWTDGTDSMNALKDGSFSYSLELESGREYQFRYLADGNRWFNDDEADSFISAGMGNEQNGLLKL